ncbi:MAG: hypothetical protein QOE87_2981, partial [Gaiellales bacterium]|nr:hypothetical protein [Gaiellales bacterium]
LAGPWFDAIDALKGDPAYTAAELPRAPATARNFADDTLVRAGGLALGPVAARTATATARCGRPWAGDEGPVPAGGLRVQASPAARLTLRARRFGDQWVMVGLLSLPPGQAVELHPRRDAAQAPYVVQVPRPAAACRI